MPKTTIEWVSTYAEDGSFTDGYSVNPIKAVNIETGKRGHFCTKVSAECLNCYAESYNLRFGVGLKYTAANLSKVRFELDTRELEQLAKMEEPVTIFPCDMTDLFHERITPWQRDRVFHWFSRMRQHTIMVLTKRPEEAVEYFRQVKAEAVDQFGEDCELLPPRNIKFGVSVGDQKTADERREHFKKIDAVSKFVSYEPALGPVDWTGWEFVNQIITGGESGPSARPYDPQWFRQTRDWCHAHGIAYFHKQNGAFISRDQLKLAGRSLEGLPARVLKRPVVIDGDELFKVGKKLSGRLLDGKEYNGIAPLPSDETWLGVCDVQS